jgi:hypothetical protein
VVVELGVAHRSIMPPSTTVVVSSGQAGTHGEPGSA